MRSAPRVGLLAALIVFLVDQATKLGVTHGLRLSEMTAERTVTPFFDLRFVANRGVSLGLLHADSATGRWLLVLMTGAIAVAVAVWMTREKQRADQIALGAILGGAIGNILDRVRLGYVVDFADLHIGDWRPFLVFNVADAAITLGVLALLARALLMREKRDDISENPHA